MMGKHFVSIGTSAMNEKFAGMAEKARREEFPPLDKATRGAWKTMETADMCLKR